MNIMITTLFESKMILMESDFDEAGHWVDVLAYQINKAHYELFGGDDEWKVANYDSDLNIILISKNKYDYMGEAQPLFIITIDGDTEHEVHGGPFVIYSIEFHELDLN